MKTITDYDSYHRIHELCEKYSFENGEWRLVPSILPMRGSSPFELAWYEDRPTQLRIKFLIHSNEEFYEFSKEQLDYIEFFISIIACARITEQHKWMQSSGHFINALRIAGGVFDPLSNDLYIIFTRSVSGGCVDSLTMRVQKVNQKFTADAKYDETCENSTVFDQVRNLIKNKKFESLAEIFNTLKLPEIQFGELCQTIGIQYDPGLSSL